MPDCLHPLLLLLTLLDLGFVQATDVVSFTGLLPLWLLAAGSPWLRRLQRFLSYRIAWNLGVLLVFTLLVHHATTTGLLHMLEDGLLLAVLCQVHLLNNVGERQRPDLVFFNSFLITFVTSFFAPDLLWSVLFVLHALALVPALQVNVLARRGCEVTKPLLRTLWRDSVPRTAAIGAATALVFALCPRDFQRQGWLGSALALRTAAEAGLGEEIRLDHERPTQLGDQIVLRIEPSSGLAEDVPSHWRGIAFSTFEGNTWQAQDARQFGTRFATDVAWETRNQSTWQRPWRPRADSLRVRQLDTSSRRLLSPLAACELRLDGGGGLLLDPKSYGGFAFLRTDDAPNEPLAFTLRLAAGANRARTSPLTREVFLQLPEHGISPVARNLATQLRSQLGADVDPATLARHSCDWLQDHRRYQLPGGPGFARNLDEFLLGSGAAHCEYFATSLALLLRLQGVPCRLIGGYLAHEWDATTHSMVARSRDAHAWVEMLLPDGTWLTLDPTPPSDAAGAQTAATTWWESSWQQLERLWTAVVTFDGKQRAELLAAAAGAPLRLLHWLLDRPLLGASGLAILAGLVYLRRRRRGQSLPAIVDLLAAARLAGIELRPGETPRELLHRAATMPVPAPQLAVLRDAAAHHEALRYRTSRGPR